MVTCVKSVNVSQMEGIEMIRAKRGFAATVAIGLLCVGFTAIAQQRSYRGTYQSVLLLIHRIEDRTDLFRNSVDAALDQSTLDGSSAEDNINLFVRDFDAAVGRLRERFGRRQSTAVDTQEVLNRGGAIDDFLKRRPTDARSQRAWSNLRLQLNQLARAYSVTWPARGRTNPGTGPYTASRLTGTYRLDPTRSDDPREAAERATHVREQKRRFISVSWKNPSQPRWPGCSVASRLPRSATDRAESQ